MSYLKFHYCGSLPACLWYCSSSCILPHPKQNILNSHSELLQFGVIIFYIITFYLKETLHKKYQAVIADIVVEGITLIGLQELEVFERLGLQGCKAVLIMMAVVVVNL